MSFVWISRFAFILAAITSWFLIVRRSIQWAIMLIKTNNDTLKSHNHLRIKWYEWHTSGWSCCYMVLSLYICLEAHAIDQSRFSISIALFLQRKALLAVDIGADRVTRVVQSNHAESGEGGSALPHPGEVSPWRRAVELHPEMLKGRGVWLSEHTTGML